MLTEIEKKRIIHEMAENSAATARSIRLSMRNTASSVACATKTEPVSSSG